MKKKPKQTFWIVMKATPFTSITSTIGVTFQWPKDGPVSFLPLFKTREGAVKWADGDEHVVQVETAE